MARIKSLQTIIQDYIDFIRLSQPEADTKPSTVIRDILIDAPATQLSAYYDKLGLVSNQLSFKDLSGIDLENYIRNFGITRKNSFPSTGIALLTFNNLASDIAVNSGDLLYSSNGVSFSVMNGTTVASRNINYYRSVALKYKNDLDFLGITDQYAAEVTVQCTSPGSIGNISKYGLNRTSISSVTNVTNIFPYDNGKDSETDSVLKNRFLSSLNGASTGTNLGYSSAAQSVIGVSDSIVIEPGDPLMTRDGTEVQINEDGSREVISEGTGGKVDVLVLGKSLQENIESFIYRDKSNTNNSSNEKNDVVLGQISTLDGKTIARKRYQANQLGVLPFQPIEQVIEVTGSESGSNFVPKSVDEYGRITGNYEIIKDSGNFNGSPFASDRFHWVSNKISNFFEDKIKGQSSGQDKVSFTNVLKFNKISQNLAIKNENSTILSDNRFVQLLHTPASSVSRVFNTNTGEQYLVVNQNPDGGLNNSTGRVQISGKTLPRATDTLQVDYNWIFEYDGFNDFDGKLNTKNSRQVTDSIDWGYGGLTKEKIIFTKDVSGNFFTGITSNQVSSLIGINKYTYATSYATAVTTGVFRGRAQIDFSYLPEKITAITSIVTDREVWGTLTKDGVIVSSLETDMSFHAQVFLPSDAVITGGSRVQMLANSTSLLDNATSNSNIVSIPTGSFTGVSKLELEVIYIAKINELFSTDVTSFPIFKNSNGFNSNSAIPTNIKAEHSYVRETVRIKKNLSNIYYIDLNCSTDNCLLTLDQLVGIWDNTNGNSLFKNCQITVNNSIYRIMLDSSVSPVLDRGAIVIYNPVFKTQFQPSMFKTEFDLIKRATFTDNGTDFYYDLNGVIDDETGISFDIVNAFTKQIETSYTDGYTVSGTMYSVATPILTPSNKVNNKLIRINSGLNIGTYGVVGFNGGYQLKINEDLTADNIVVIKISDNKDLSGLVSNANSQGITMSNADPNNGALMLIGIIKTNKLRNVPTNLGINLIDQNSNTGVIQITGSTLLKITSVFTATSTGLKQNISELLRSQNLSGYTIADIAYLAKVNTTSFNSQEIVSINNEYDLVSCKIKYNAFSNMLSDLSLSANEFQLAASVKNTLDNGSEIFIPKIGDRLQITIYLTKEESEILSFARTGILYTNKKFISVKNISVLSGFKSTVNSRLSVSNLNQPGLNSRYRVYYDYVAPKTNERIVIRYNYNKIINDVTLAIEKIRPINADVIAKEAKQVGINVTMNIVIIQGSQVSANTIVQNLRDALINALNSETLGGVIDSSDLINTAYSITGIDRVRILAFNRDEQLGQVLSVTAQKDEYFVANNVIINVESR